MIIISLLFAIIFVLLFFAGLIFFILLEKIVCTEVCNIYCNTIVALDQFVGEAIEIGEEWQKIVFKATLDNQIEQQTIERALKMLEMKKLHLCELYSMTPIFSYQSSLAKKIILSKHKLPLQEIELACTLPKSTYEELEAFINDTISNFKNQDIDLLHLNFVQVKLQAFKHETFGMFYGALEGICSFPLHVLSVYNEVANQIKYLPKSVGCSKRKEDYLHFQEIEMNKAQSILDNYDNLLKNTEIITDGYVDILTKHDVNMFFSGSKSLESERNIFNGVVVRQQTKWRSKGINIFGFSYQNFPHEVVKEGHQAKYDEFIQYNTDAIFFVLNGNVGGYTQKEFDLAMQAFCKAGKPKIFVYSKVGDSANESVEVLRNTISQQKQYWQDYKDKEQLKLLLENDMSAVIVDICDKNNELRRKLLE